MAQFTLTATLASQCLLHQLDFKHLPNLQMSQHKLLFSFKRNYIHVFECSSSSDKEIKKFISSSVSTNYQSNYTLIYILHRRFSLEKLLTVQQVL